MVTISEGLSQWFGENEESIFWIGVPISGPGYKDLYLTLSNRLRGCLRMQLEAKLLRVEKHTALPLPAT